MKIIDQVEILLVDDSETDAELAIRSLKKHNLANKLTWVKDGQEALDYLFRQGDYTQREDTIPRIIFLDLNMPRVNGFEVLKAIKADERTKRIPVVVMTSSREDQDVLQTYDLGVNSYVVKPLDFNALADVVGHAGYYWLAVNRTPTS
jgi:CheY-like chemotaxis protein